MATRGMFIFENQGQHPKNVYVHWDTYPEHAAKMFAEWLAKSGTATPEMFCKLNEGNMEQDEHSHPDIEWRYRLIYPSLPKLGFEVDKVPNHLAIILVQNRRVTDTQADDFYGSWVTEYCGPMFAFLDSYIAESDRTKYLEEEVFSH